MTFQKKKFFNLFLKSHIQFLQTLREMNKTFRIECFVFSKTNVSVVLKKTVIQTNQKSDMNMIFEHFIRQLKLSLHSLNEIEFDEFIMRTADHKNTSLKY